MAGPVEIYFSAGPYQCGNATMIAEWRLKGDTETEIDLETYQRRTDRTGTRFEGQTWSLPISVFSDPLDLTDTSGRAVWRVSGLLDERPVVLALSRRGEVRTDCEPDLQAVDPARARFDEVLALLDTAQPGPDEAVLVNPAIDTLPPLNMLPELERTGTQAAVRDKSSAFWDRYREAALERADDPQDILIVEGLDQVLAAHQRRDLRQWHADLLTEALERRATAIRNAGGDPKTGALSKAAFCNRLSHLPNISQWGRFLLTATGVPVIDWDEGFAQDHLDMAAQCDAGKSFSDTVTRRWPEIQQMGAGAADLEAEAERLAQAPLSLTSVASENWFEISRDTFTTYRSLGLNDQSVRATLQPVLDQRREEAAPVLGQELAAGLESAPFADIPQWCSTQSRAAYEGFRPPSLLQQAAAFCETKAAEMWKSAGLSQIEGRRLEIESLNDSAESLIGNDFYSVGLTLPRSAQLPGPLQEVHSDLAGAIAEADTALEPKRQAAIAAARQEIEAGFEEAGPLDPDGKATSSCAPFVNSFDRRLEGLRNICVTQMNALNARRQEARCDEIWASTPAPKGFREGRLSTPFGTAAVSINNLVCSHDFQTSGLSVEDNSGFIFSEHLLTNERVIGGTPVRFSAVLTKPSTEAGEWTLTDAKLNGTRLTGPDYATSADFMRCAIFLEECFRQN